MKRIILFRCHKSADVVQNRVQTIRHKSPDIPVYAMFGGLEEEYESFRKATNNLWDDIYCIRGKTDKWKWLHSDFAMLNWYKDIGAKINFDVLHLIEWDLLLADNIASLYAHIPAQSIGLTGLVPFDEIIGNWTYWTELNQSWWVSQWEQLKDFCRKRFGYTGIPHACQGPGPCFPKDFLSDYSKQNVPELCHDEVRIPIMGQSLGYNLADTGFYKKWFDKNEQQFFNCELDRCLISAEVIKSECNKSDGRRVFHPVRNIVTV